MGFAPILIVVILGTFSLVGYLILKTFQAPTPASRINLGNYLPSSPNNYESPGEPYLHPPVTVNPQNWSTYVNKKYGYSFKHPQESGVGSREQPGGDESELTHVSFGLFNVEAQDPELLWDGVDPIILKTMKLPIKEFTQEIWKQNKEDTNSSNQYKEVGQISQSTVGGNIAYQFTLTGSFDGMMGGYVLNQKYLYLFVENKGLNYIIWFPPYYNTERAILESFKFTN